MAGSGTDRGGPLRSSSPWFPSQKYSLIGMLPVHRAGRKTPARGTCASRAPRRSRSGDDPSSHRVQHEFGRVVHIELLQDVRAMGFNRGWTD